MRLYRFQREKTIGFHNFGDMQVYVCLLSDIKGELHPGLSIVTSASIFEVPYPLSKPEAISFAASIRAAANGSVPLKVTLKGSYANMYTSTAIKFTGVEDNQLKARFFQGMFIFGQYGWTTMQSGSVLICANSIENLVWD